MADKRAAEAAPILGPPSNLFRAWSVKLEPAGRIMPLIEGPRTTRAVKWRDHRQVRSSQPVPPFLIHRSNRTGGSNG